MKKVFENFFSRSFRDKETVLTKLFFKKRKNFSQFVKTVFLPPIIFFFKFDKRIFGIADMAPLKTVLKFF